MGNWKSLHQHEKIALLENVKQSSTLRQLERIYRRNGAPHSLSFSTESANEAFFAEPTLAFIGYSDRIKYLRSHAHDNGHEDMIFSQPLCLNEKGVVKMFSDVFVVPSHVRDSKLEAVEKFWNFMNRNETISNFLAVADQPEKAAYPRAILPAKIDFWKDDMLVQDDDLRVMMQSLKGFELRAFVLSPEDIASLNQSEKSIERAIDRVTQTGPELSLVRMG